MSPFKSLFYKLTPFSYIFYICIQRKIRQHYALSQSMPLAPHSFGTKFNLKANKLPFAPFRYVLDQRSPPLHLSLPPPGPPYDWDTANGNTFSYTTSTIWDCFIYISFTCHLFKIQFPLVFSFSSWNLFLSPCLLYVIHYCLFVVGSVDR